MSYHHILPNNNKKQHTLHPITSFSLSVVVPTPVEQSVLEKNKTHTNADP
jgi:hypothetical protein